MRRLSTVVLIIALIGFLTYLLWATSEVYVVGFRLSSGWATAVHICAYSFSGLFIFSFLSGRMVFAERIRILYKLFNIFVGLVVYLSPAAFVLGIIMVFTTLSSATTILLSTIAMCAALALGITGLLQSRVIKVKRYTVALPTAPASWNGRRILLVSDTHYGLVNHARVSKKVVARIKAIAPNLIIHAGDFYDGPKITMSTITPPWKALAATIPIFYAPGNHEHYGDYEGFIRSLRDAGLRVLVDEKTVYDGVQIAGIQYRDKSKKHEAENAINALGIDPSMAAILINHPPTFHTSAVNAGISLMLSGHTHRGQFWPINYLVWLFYGKYTYGLHRVETMTAITSSGVGTSGPPTRLFNTPELVEITIATA